MEKKKQREDDNKQKMEDLNYIRENLYFPNHKEDDDDEEVDIFT